MSNKRLLLCAICRKQIAYQYEIEDRGETYCIACWEQHPNSDSAAGRVR